MRAKVLFFQPISNKTKTSRVLRRMGLYSSSFSWTSDWLISTLVATLIDFMITLALVLRHSDYVYYFSFTAITKCSQEKTEKEVSSEETRKTRSCLPLTEQKIATSEKNRINSKGEKEKCISKSCTGQEEKRQLGLVI